MWVNVSVGVSVCVCAKMPSRFPPVVFYTPKELGVCVCVCVRCAYRSSCLPLELDAQIGPSLFGAILVYLSQRALSEGTAVIIRPHHTV